MKPYASFRRHPLGVVARTNEDRHPVQVVPFGRYGAGLWTGHPIELLVVVGMLLIGWIGIPEMALVLWPYGIGGERYGVFSLAAQSIDYGCASGRAARLSLFENAS